MSDKITVNGALVSTDVDRLIRTISEKKRVELAELERLTGMDRRAIDKWVRVLEDEGYISIVYGLRGTNILWLGEEARHSDKDLDAALSGMETKQAHEAYDEVFSEISKGDESERRLEEYLKRKQSDKGDGSDIKSSILGKLDSRRDSGVRPAASGHPDAPDGPEAPEPESMESGIETRRQDFQAVADEMLTERKEPKTLEAKPSFAAVPHDEVERRAEPDAVEHEEARKPARMTGESAKAKELVNAYLNEMNKERANLEKLKAEKDRIYRERYLSLESKVEADIASITERILEKEGRVLALKERVLELPDKVEEVEKVHKMITKLETDGREVLKKARADVEQFMETVDASKEELEGRMADARSKIDGEKGRIAELKRLSGDVESRVADLRKSADGTQEQIGELNSAMKELLADLEDATEMKVEISDMVERVRSSMESKEAELDGLEGQMASIEKVEKWVREYVNDYESKIDGITSYVRAGDEELSALQESAEAAYIKKYLRELDGMTANYDSELNKATGEEKDVESKIADSKRRLAELVRDSKEMITKLRTDTSGIADFETVRQEAQNKLGSVTQLLAEKEAEREMLGEDIRTAKGTVSASPRRSYSARPAKKLVRRRARSAKKFKGKKRK